MLVTPDKPLGDYRSIVLARATMDRIRASASGGGAVTAVLLYLLDSGTVDAVVTAKRRRGLVGELVVARSSRELLEYVGNVWTVLPYTTKLREALESEDIKRVAFVGLPCQAQLLYQMRMFPLMETDFVSKIYLVVSLFCLGTFAQEAFTEFLRVRYSLDPSKIESIRISGEGLEVVYEGTRRIIPLSEIVGCMQAGCLVCPDYTGVFSDLSAGVCESKPGYTVMIIRSARGEEVVKAAASKGYLEYVKAGADVVEEVTMKAQAKALRAAKYMSILL